MSSTAPMQHEHPSAPVYATNIPPRVLAIRQRLADAGLSTDEAAAIEAPMYGYFFRSWEVGGPEVGDDRACVIDQEGYRNSFMQQLRHVPVEVLSLDQRIGCEQLADAEAAAAKAAGEAATDPAD
jgi:hypothetical protein